MSSVANHSPAAAYLTKSNIVHPWSEYGTQGLAHVTSAEAAARTSIGDRNGGVTVTGGSIQRSRG